MPAEFDEEEVLGFPIWVAELELLIGGKGAGPADAAEYFQLLQKLLVTVQRDERDLVKANQRRCDDKLFDLIVAGCPPPVRRLISSILAMLYLVGDSLPLYSRVNSLLNLITAKDAAQRSQECKAGALECLASLCAAHGRQLATRVPEIATAAAKYCGKSVPMTVRSAALRCLAACVEGLGGDHRAAAAVQEQTFKLADKLNKEKGVPTVRLGCAAIVAAIARCGAAGLWGNGGALFTEAVSMCTGALDDQDAAVRVAMAQALGGLAAAAKSTVAQDAVRASIKSKAAVLQRQLLEATISCLVQPFALHANAGHTLACTAMTQGWSTAVEQMQSLGNLDDTVLTDLAHKAIDCLQLLNKAPGAEELGAGQASGELPHAQACVAHILRTAILDRMQEATQRQLLGRMAALLTGQVKSVPVTSAMLECARTLLDVLGEVAVEEYTEVEQSLLPLMYSSSVHLRVQVGACMATLALATPSRAAQLLRSALGMLRHALQTLVDAQAYRKSSSNSGRADTEVRPIPSTDTEALPSNGSTAGLTLSVPVALACVHGASYAAAAVVAAVSRLPLSVPSSLLAEVTELSRAMITAPVCRNAQQVCLEREGGYTMLAALVLALPLEALAGSQLELLSLWLVALGKEAAQALCRRVASPTGDEATWQQVLAADFNWRSAALDALWVLITITLAEGSTVHQADQHQFVKAVVALLRPTLDVFFKNTAMQDSQRGRGGVGSVWTAAATRLQLALVRAYAAIPSCSSFAKDHESLIRMCSRLMRAGADTGNASTAVDALLHRILKPQDGVLGPWYAGQDPQEVALHSFTGTPGSPLPPPWHAAAVQLPGAPTRILSQSTRTQFFQQDSLGTALLVAQADLLAQLLAVVSDNNQALMVDMLVSAASWGGQPKKAPKEPHKRFTVVGSAAAVVLAGIDRQLKRLKGTNNDLLAQRLRELADRVLEEAARQSESPSHMSHGIALQRTASELYGLAGTVGSGAYASKLLKDLCQQMAETTSSFTRQCLALATACLHRSGGVHMQMMVSPTVLTLLAVVRGSSAPARLWAMHALWVIGNAVGPTYIQHVKDTQSTMLLVLLHEESYFWHGMRPTLGRLANAMVAVMGPEFALGSDAYVHVKSVIREMEAFEGSGVSLVSQGGMLDGTAAELERVLYSQMLILFAPHAVEPRTQLPLLLATLQSKQPPLRQAAAATLRHLAERDTAAVLPDHIERSLLAALDDETSDITVQQLQATLQTLMRVGAPLEPLLWLHTLAEVANATPPPAASAVTGGRIADASSEISEQGDGGDDVDEGTLQQAGDAAAGNAVQDPSAKLTPRLRTRLFAAQCLLQLPGLLAEGSSADPKTTAALVTLLVDIAYKMTTGSGSALRPLGLRLLQEVVQVYVGVEDPLLEGARLMDQHQAQIVSALRVSLSKDASPPLMAQGAALAALYLENGMASGDPAVLERLMALLITPLLQPSVEAHNYAEWVVVRGSVALLEANAHCAAFAASCNEEATAQMITHAHQPYQEILLDMWCSLLQDFSIVNSQHPSVWSQYKPRLLTTLSPAVVVKFQHALERAWLPVLDAASWKLATITGGDAAVRTEQWQILLDITFMAIALTSKELQRGLEGPVNGAANGQSTRLSSHSRMLSIGQVLAEDGRTDDAHRDGRFAVALTALQRVLAASQHAAAEQLTAQRAIDILNLLVDAMQQVCVPLLSALCQGNSHLSLSYCSSVRALAGIADQVVTLVAPLCAQHEELSRCCAEALLKLLALAAPSDRHGDRLTLLQVEGLRQADQHLLHEGVALVATALGSLQRHYPDLRPLALSVLAQLLSQLPEGPSMASSTTAFIAILRRALVLSGTAEGIKQGNGEGQADSCAEDTATGVLQVCAPCVAALCQTFGACSDALFSRSSNIPVLPPPVVPGDPSKEPTERLQGRIRGVAAVLLDVGGLLEAHRRQKCSNLNGQGASANQPEAGADGFDDDDFGDFADFGDAEVVSHSSFQDSNTETNLGNDGPAQFAASVNDTVENGPSSMSASDHVNSVAMGAAVEGSSLPSVTSTGAVTVTLAVEDDACELLLTTTEQAGTAALKAAADAVPKELTAVNSAPDHVHDATTSQGQNCDSAQAGTDAGIHTTQLPVQMQQTILHHVLAALRLKSSRVTVPVVQALLRHLQHAAAVADGTAASEQSTASATAEQAGTVDWSCTAFAAIATEVTAAAQTVLHSANPAEASLEEVQVTADILKMFVATVPLAAKTQGQTDSALSALVNTLVPLLLDAAAPPALASAVSVQSVGGVDIAQQPAAHPVLRDLAIKLITHLATGSTAPQFRSAVAALPQDGKQRLQSALQAQQARASEHAAANTKKPTIQLKKFGA